MKKSILMFLFGLISTPGYTKVIDIYYINLYTYTHDLNRSSLAPSTEIVEIGVLTAGEKGLEWEFKDGFFPAELTTPFVEKWTQEGKKVSATLTESFSYNFDDYKRLLEKQPFSRLEFNLHNDFPNKEDFLNTLQTIKRAFPNIDIYLYIPYITDKDDYNYDYLISFIRMAKEKGLDFKVEIASYGEEPTKERVEEIAKTLGVSVNQLFFAIDENDLVESDDFNYFRYI